MWRKNRKRNQDGTYGVDLNRNYGGIGFGGSGSSGRTSDETYRGASAFSEIETQRVRDFVLKRTKTKVLITYHTFSKLILWPWGHTYNQIPNTTDRRVFETMGNEMSKWTGYKAEKASDLYLASGDTTDWAYGEKGIFAFTFELDPGTNQQGGFYPGVGAIQTTFSKNIEPALYAIDMGIDPYSVLPTMNSLTQNLVDTLLPRFSIK
jgi:carboxypeptidase T